MKGNIYRGSVLASVIGVWAVAGPGRADVPKVVTDVAPVQSIVAMVMGDLGTPEVLMSPGQTPHSFSMRPSQARALDQADLIVWVGEGLTPWLVKPMESLGEDAVGFSLLDVPGTNLLDYRETAVFAHDDHDDHGDHDDHDDHEEHGDAHADHDDHDDHDEHGDAYADHDDHDDHDEHDDHGEEHADHHDHHHHEGGTDPHAWLDPQNGQIWLAALAERFAALDPEHAETYRANADAAIADLKALEAELSATLESAKAQALLTIHDAYQYFETRFGLTVVGALREGDASDASPARLKEIQEAVAEAKVTCVFSEPQFNTRMIDTVADEAGLKLAVIDPLGSKQEPGPGLYPGLLRAMAEEIAGCG